MNMTDRKRFFILALLMAMMATLMVFAAGCSKVEDDEIETECGWTINEDGSYSYACIIKNTSENMALEAAGVEIVGLDAEGNKMQKLSDFEGGYTMTGSLMPGEKTVMTMDRYTSTEPIMREWEEAPAGFRADIKETHWIDAEEMKDRITDVHIESAEEVYEYGDYAEYDITLVNEGEEDVKVEPDGDDYFFEVAAVFRDEEGKIIGGDSGDLVLDENVEVISFPAGEKVTTRIAFNEVHPGEPEFILTWFDNRDFE